MSDGTKWQKYVREVGDKGFNYSSPLSRLVWSCEVGRGIDQHASTDIQAIIDERAEMLELLKEIETKEICPVCGSKLYYALHTRVDAMIKKLEE